MKFFGRDIGAFLKFTQTEARPDQGKVMTDLLKGKLVKFALSRRGARGTAEKGTGDICEITAWTHHIRIQAHKIP